VLYVLLTPEARRADEIKTDIRQAPGKPKAWLIGVLNIAGGFASYSFLQQSNHKPAQMLRHTADYCQLPKADNNEEKTPP
jgi:hypothetical protein